MSLIENIITIFEQMGSVISSFSFIDLIDILFVSFIIYHAVKLIRETRAFQLAKGLAIVAVVYFIVNVTDMRASSFLFSRLLSDVLILLIVLFQPEIRSAIEHMGRGGLPIFKHALDEEKGSELRMAIIEIAKACQRMSDSKTGSIIIMERKTLLGDIIETGHITDSAITHELVGNIFFPNAPLHDGAVIVRDARIYAAGCVLPLTHNSDLPSDLGMRHRAAIGVTEQSDAVAVITSEETGTISICSNGSIERDFDEASLRTRLFDYFDIDKEDSDTSPAPVKYIKKAKNKFAEVFKRNK
jgi:diadenylate cyclase